MGKSVLIAGSALAAFSIAAGIRQNLPGWAIGPFARAGNSEPVLTPLPDVTFPDPMTGKPVAWEHDNTFNPAATAKDGKLYVLYRAEDDSGQGIGFHTSRIGLASSSDGVHFERLSKPVLFPADDSQKQYDWPGGDEDPRVVSVGDGYLMTYTAWDRKTARLSTATSRDLVHWVKHGPVFAKTPFLNTWSKSGSIVTRRVGDRFQAVRIHGLYWMFWGEGPICLATSRNLIDWTPVLGSDGKPLPILAKRPGLFDSSLTEAGPPAVLTPEGIVLIYNGKNQDDSSISAGAYSAGEALMSPSDPAKVLKRLDKPFFRPERPWEVTGQYASGTVFVEGLAHFKGRLWLFYGAADSKVGVATAP